ncbi:MAG TPA: hypothetical protein VNE63_22270 [Candidatus Acidoferrales bacterium]|nr:hypothetical protein [Candidatus Acidoferrales bacterium]
MRGQLSTRTAAANGDFSARVPLGGYGGVMRQIAQNDRQLGTIQISADSWVNLLQNGNLDPVRSNRSARLKQSNATLICKSP